MTISQTLLFFSKAFFASVAMQMPVGPISILCIKKTLELGIRGAILVGFGTALADSVYAIVAALGLSTISEIMNENESTIKLFGGLFLLYLAYKESVNIKIPNEITIKNQENFKTIIEVFFLSAISPVNILIFLSIFTSADINPTSTIESIMLVAGIFLGSITWWYLLGLVIVKIKNKLPPVFLMYIKRISCFIFVGFGLFVIFDVFTNLHY
jgi:putative LysE/RhtB family amino acid efflux pump